MRLKHLDLLRYGCFKDKALDFPADKADLHIIYGPNEAGKSTALSAIEDLLFGIPKKTNYSFLFDNNALRIGAVIQNGNGGDPLCFRRRKGNKETILDEQENPLPDAILNNFLQGVDQPFFERMFSLDHERLRDGGKEILDGKDDVGRTLFSASAGLLGLAEVLKKLEENADQLWNRRKSGKRLYYQAQEKYQDAEKRKKEATTLTKSWKENQKQLDEISEKHTQSNLLFTEKMATQKKLERIRRTLPYLVQIKRLEEEISKIGSVPCFPENATKALEVAEKDLNQSNTTLKNLTDQINEAQKDLDKIELNKRLLDRESEIKKLDNDCAIVNKHEKDIPDRQTEIEVLKNKRHDLVNELGWPLERIEKENFFPQTLSIKIEDLIKQKDSLGTRLEATNEAWQGTKSRHDTLQEEIAQSGQVPESTSLETAIRNVRGKGALWKNIEKNEDELSGLNRQIEANLESLLLWEGSIEQLERLSIPQVVTIEQYNQEFSDLKDSQKDNGVEIKRFQDELDEFKLKRDQLVRDKQAIALEQLEEARQIRNSGWDIIRRKHLDDGDVSEDEIRIFSNEKPIAEAYEEAVKYADDIADQRFTSAKETAMLTEISQKIERLEHQVETRRIECTNLQEQQAKLDKRWSNIWKDCGFEPLNPQEMLGWMESRRTILAEQGQKLTYVRQEEHLQTEIEEAKRLLNHELAQVDQDTTKIREKPLNLLLEHAETIKSDLNKKATRLEGLREQAPDTERELSNARKKYDTVVEEKKQWEKEWKDALEKAGLPSSSSQNDIGFYLTSIKEIKEAGQEISTIRITRIETMKRDIEKFHEDITKLSGELGLGQGNTDDKETANSLAHRLEEERKKYTRKETLEKQINDLQEKDTKQKEERETALAQLNPLCKTAETDDLSVLREKIDTCSRLRTLEKEKEKVLNSLISGGDGKSRDELEKECEDKDSDEVTAELTSLSNELTEINGDLQCLSEQKIQAKAELDKISGKADAAEAEVDRQFALTDMGYSAEQYVKMKTATILLQWGLEKFRKEKQGPLLERASEIFKVLTLDSFSKLMVNSDDKDNRYLAGMRPDETQVGVDGMSGGTVDQLYLALRLAAIEEYVQKSQPLPFVADDLFINYDNNRAGSGFKALVDLSRKTQVLFFTHHEHLLDVAKQALPPEQFVVHRI